MALRRSELKQRLLNKTGMDGALNRLSDLQGALYGGRGNEYDELQYLRHQNTDTTANQKLSDAWVKFAPANSSGSTSIDTINRNTIL